jgi:hypothetical protein
MADSSIRWKLHAVVIWRTLELPQRSLATCIHVRRGRHDKDSGHSRRERGHLAALSESVACLSWLQADSKRGGGGEAVEMLVMLLLFGNVDLLLFGNVDLTKRGKARTGDWLKWIFESRSSPGCELTPRRCCSRLHHGQGLANFLCTAKEAFPEISNHSAAQLQLCSHTKHA